MASFEKRRMLTAARILLLMAVVEPGAGVSQSVSPNDGTAPALAQSEQWAEIDARDAELIGPFSELALHYQDSGDHAFAAAAIERALNVARVNYGLHSLKLAPLIRQAIDNEAARDNSAVAWELTEKLLNLAMRHPDDLRTVPILREIADERMDVLEQYLSGRFPPEIILGCYYRPPNVRYGSCTAGSKSAAARHLLLETWKYYEAAIAVLLLNQCYSCKDLTELELQLIRSNYFHGGKLTPDFRYERGRERIHRLVHYDVEESDVLGQVTALVEVADWDLIYSMNSLALKTYEESYERLMNEGVTRESIEGLFSPRTPIVLPTFLPNPLVSEMTPRSKGFIDVSFEITRYGRSRRIEILDTTENATKSAKKRLNHLIASSRFRPTTENGEFAGTSPVVVRYYLND